MLCSSLLAAALTITAGGDAFMVQGFPQDYKPDKTLTEWIGSGDARLVKIEMLPIELHWMKDWSVNGLPRTADGEASGVILAALKRTSAEFGTQFSLRADGVIEVALPKAK